MSSPPNDALGYRATYDRGISRFNEARFFEAHEDLEEAWRLTPREDPSRRHLQGLVQLAVAFHHESTGNRVGARSVLERAVENLKGAEGSFPGLDFEKLRIDLADWQKYFFAAGERPNPPHIKNRISAP